MGVSSEFSKPRTLNLELSLASLFSLISNSKLSTQNFSLNPSSSVPLVSFHVAHFKFHITSPLSGLAR